MKWQIILSGLRARPVRTGVTIMAVSLQVALILVIVGLTTGTANEIGKRIAGVGADIMFQAPGADVLLAANGANLKEKFATELAAKEGIQRVAPVLVKISTAPLVNIFGIDPESFNEVSGGLVYLDGKVFSEPDEIVIDDIFSRDKKLKVGDSIELIKHKFKVSGIVQNGKGSRVFMGLEAAQDLNNSPNMVSVFFIKLKDSRNINAAIEKLSADFPGYELRNVPEYAALMNGASIPDSMISMPWLFSSLCASASW